RLIPRRQHWHGDEDRVQRGDLVGHAERTGNGEQQLFFALWLAALRGLRKREWRQSRRPGGPLSGLLRGQAPAVFRARRRSTRAGQQRLRLTVPLRRAAGRRFVDAV